MISIPKELLEQFKRGNVLLFIGEHLLTDREGHIVLDNLTDELIRRIGSEDTDDWTFPVAAQIYQDERNRQALIQLVRDHYRELNGKPQAVDRLIAGVQECTTFVTTRIDRQLERAFEKAGRSFDVFISGVDIPYGESRRTELYMLRGSIERPSSLILTEDDLEKFFDNNENISVILQSYIARMTILFVGFDLGDAYFRRLYSKVTGSLEKHNRRSYAFGAVLSRRALNWCRRHDIEVIDVNAAIFLHELVDRLADQPHPIPPASHPDSSDDKQLLPRQPYKFLDYYETHDAAIYFGRRHETHTLGAMIHAHRLVVLFGASGAGKTSLLLAGIVPLMESANPPYKMIYVRTLEDPLREIRANVRRQLPKAQLPENGSIVSYLSAAAKAFNATILIILDQFEEFFVYQNSQKQSAFIDCLGKLYHADHIPLKIILSLREDWLASLSDFEQRISRVLVNRLRLLPLSDEAAKEAIVGPATRLELHYEEGLVERITGDLMGSDGKTVAPPQLQLICSALYKKLAPGETRIKISSYDELGGVGGVLKDYLDEELAILQPEQRLLARAVLEELVSSQGTKAVKTADELALSLGVEHNELEPVLLRLFRSSLLRTFERENGDRVIEVAHEYLIDEVQLDKDAKKRRAAEELIKQEVDSSKRFGTMLAADKLTLIDEVRESLRINPRAQELLARSALLNEHGSSAYWLNRVEDEAKLSEIIEDSVDSERIATRAWTAQVLGQLDKPVAKGQLAELLLTDPSSAVYSKAAVSLASIDNARFNVCIQQLLSGSPSSQQRAVDAYESVQDVDALSLNLTQRAHFKLRWRGLQRKLKRNRVQRNVLTLYSALGGMLSAAIGGLFGAILSGSRELLPYHTMLAAVIGLAIGAGIGLGYGTIHAMELRRRSFYIAGSTLGGGATGMLIGSGDIQLLDALLGAMIGLAAGVVCAIGVTIIHDLTRGITTPSHRLTIRLALGLVFCVIPGTIFIQGVHMHVIPLGPAYGFGIGLLVPGISGGLEMAERRLSTASTKFLNVFSQRKLSIT